MDKSKMHESSLIKNRQINKMLSVSEPEVIVLLVPESPATSNEVATFATKLAESIPEEVEE